MSDDILITPIDTQNSIKSTTNTLPQNTESQSLTTSTSPTLTETEITDANATIKKSGKPDLFDDVWDLGGDTKGDHHINNVEFDPFVVDKNDDWDSALRVYEPSRKIDDGTVKPVSHQQKPTTSTTNKNTQKRTAAKKNTNPTPPTKTKTNQKKYKGDKEDFCDDYDDSYYQ
jgi:hypothetical protein